MKKKSKKVCKCNIRGLIRLWVIKEGLFHCVHPREEDRYIHKFKYCPMCGVKI